MLGRFAWFADRFEELVASLAVVVVIAAVSWGVLTRYVTAQPATWAGEVATLAFAWVVFFGAAGCIKYQLHPEIDLLVTRLPTAARTAVRWFNHVLLLGFFAFMVWFGTRFSLDALDSPSAVLRIPLTWLYGPVTVAFALMFVRYVQRLRGRRWHVDELRETLAG